MWLFIKRLWRFLGFLSLVVGWFYLPVDVQGLADAAEPWRRLLSMLDRENLMTAIMILMLAYIFWIDFRPALKEWKAQRSWIGPPEAAKIIYAHMRNHSIAKKLVSEKQGQGHPEPVVGGMASWIEDGINLKIIRARGHQVYDDKEEDIPADIKILDGKLFGPPNAVEEKLAAKSHEKDTTWIDLSFSMSSVRAYVKYLQSDAFDRNRIKAMKQERG